MRLHAIKAKEGDAILLESSAGMFVLVDGGPAEVWENDLQPYLESVVGDGALEAVVVSHVDRDHIVGVLDLFAENERLSSQDERARPTVRELWHNSFSKTVDHEGQVVAALRTAAAKGATYGVSVQSTDWVLFGIGDGEKLRREAVRAKVPINKAFGGELVSPGTVGEDSKEFAGLLFRIVGPTTSNLQSLKTEWLDWASKVKQARKGQELAYTDRSVPNLSSIVFLVEEDDRSVLMTGDARGDHILQGLEQAGLMKGGSLHVNVLKLQHHGSARNVAREFFKLVTADVYIISANGRHGNPDHETLAWIVEEAALAKRSIKIAATYETDTIRELADSHPMETYGYTLLHPEDAAHALVIVV